MKRLQVKSSNLRSVGYDKETKTLEVEFPNGTLYHYSGIDKQTYSELMNAESIGRHFNISIRNHFKGEKIPDPNMLKCGHPKKLEMTTDNGEKYCEACRLNSRIIVGRVISTTRLAK